MSSMDRFSAFHRHSFCARRIERFCAHCSAGCRPVGTGRGRNGRRAADPDGAGNQPLGIPDRAMTGWVSMTTPASCWPIPTFRRRNKLRAYAEDALDRDAVGSEQLVVVLRPVPAADQPARARYALALAALERPEARERRARGVARWRDERPFRSLSCSACSAHSFARRSRCADGCAAVAGQTRSGAAAGRLSHRPIRAIAMARLALLQGRFLKRLALPFRPMPIAIRAMSTTGCANCASADKVASAVNLLANRPPLLAGRLRCGRLGRRNAAPARGQRDSRSAPRIAASDR